jgi:hypothetical protein
MSFVIPRLATLLLVLHVHAASQDSTARAPIAVILARGYQILETDPKAAIPLFEEAVKADSTNLLARRQLGSLYITSGRPEDALTQLQVANDLSRSDTTSLQIAYLLNALGQNREAYALFSSLQQSHDPEIREKAGTAVQVLAPVLCAASYPWWMRAYAAPYYDSRFENSIFNGALSAGHYLTSDREFSLFGTFSITRDTRSAGGAAPEIFSDNYLLLGGGIRVEPVRGFVTDLQMGLAADLVDRPGEPSFTGDFRIVSSYGAGWFPPVSPAPELSFPLLPFADFYTSIGYYSRYSNVIGYGLGRAGVRLATSGHASVDVYIRTDLNGDTDRAFYNNVAEISAGLRVTPDYRWGLTMLIEQHRGTYWGSTARPVSYDRQYSSFRIFLILDKPLCF